MLTSIRCDAFVDDLRQIDIKPGLNTIVSIRQYNDLFVLLPA